jgi:hypothetical protein
VFSACASTELVVALPPVLFEGDLPATRRLLERCAHAGATVEVNSWGGWHLARQAGVRMESGPGLPVLNSLAAHFLAQCGIQCVTLSVEADRQQLADTTARCPVSLSLVVYGRPPLMITRARPPAEFLGKVFEDRRGIRISPRLEHGLWVFRPLEPFDLRDCTGGGIRAEHLVMDLVGSDDPVRDWRSRPAEHPLRFNYGRALA